MSTLKYVMFTGRVTAENTPGMPDWAIISITDPQHGVPPAKLLSGWYAVHRAGFYDVPHREEERGKLKVCDAQDAKDMIAFVASVAPHVSGIMVHCEGGVSRSGAIAKWIAEAYNLPFNHHYTRYHEDIYWLIREEAIKLKNES